MQLEQAYASGNRAHLEAEAVSFLPYDGGDGVGEGT